MDRDSIDSVLRSLRRVNLQGSLFGHTVALRFGLSESDIEAIEVLIDSGAATAGNPAVMNCNSAIWAVASCIATRSGWKSA